MATRGHCIADNGVCVRRSEIITSSPGANVQHNAASSRPEVALFTAKALDELGFSHDTSTPHRPETNAIAESAVKKVKEGTACTIYQSGFSEERWVYAMMCFCFLRNVVDKLAETGVTITNKSHGGQSQDVIEMRQQHTTIAVVLFITGLLTGHSFLRYL